MLDDQLCLRLGQTEVQGSGGLETRKDIITGKGCFMSKGMEVKMDTKSKTRRPGDQY